ncbi:MAG TPA: EF-Tu/IF-2/RF-3 family GTPase, partial [Elusimicrobiales bacterium]|nr:EF-Tu/IF-2/RF-3 family GTPase [Elusimicrobiales bacterium]
AIIFSFHTDTEPKAKEEAEKEGIEIRNYNIIFELLEDVRAAMEGLLEPEIVEETLGKAKVKQKFNLSSGLVAGSMITEGKITRGTKARVLRNNEVILKSKVTGLKRFKEDVKEVEKGYECGILVENYKDIQPDDIIETIREKTVVRRLKEND